MIDTLQATPQAMKLMDDLITGQLELSPSVSKVLYPLIRLVLRPALRFNYLSIVGLLDPRLRERLGVSWSAQEERQLMRIYKVIRIAYRVLPDRLTYFPLAGLSRAQAPGVPGQDEGTSEEVLCLSGARRRYTLGRPRAAPPKRAAEMRPFFARSAPGS